MLAQLKEDHDLCQRCFVASFAREEGWRKSVEEVASKPLNSEPIDEGDDEDAIQVVKVVADAMRRG